MNDWCTLRTYTPKRVWEIMTTDDGRVIVKPSHETMNNQTLHKVSCLFPDLIELLNSGKLIRIKYIDLLKKGNRTDFMIIWNELPNSMKEVTETDKMEGPILCVLINKDKTFTLVERPGERNVAIPNDGDITRILPSLSNDSEGDQRADLKPTEEKSSQLRVLTRATLKMMSTTTGATYEPQIETPLQVVMQFGYMTFDEFGDDQVVLTGPSTNSKPGRIAGYLHWNGPVPYEKKGKWIGQIVYFAPPIRKECGNIKSGPMTVSDKVTVFGTIKIFSIQETGEGKKEEEYFPVWKVSEDTQHISEQEPAFQFCFYVEN